MAKQSTRSRRHVEKRRQNRHEATRSRRSVHKSANGRQIAVAPVHGLRHTEQQSDNPKHLVGASKVPLSLIPSSALVPFAEAMGDGARKYGPYNWRVTKVSARTYIEGALRHLRALLDGEDCASDSGVHHCGHVMAGMAIFFDALTLGQLIDDRPLPGVTAELMAAYAAKQKAKAKPSRKRRV